MLCKAQIFNPKETEIKNRLTSDPRPVVTRATIVKLNSIPRKNIIKFGLGNTALTKTCSPSRKRSKIVEIDVTGDRHIKNTILKVSFEPDGVSNPVDKIAYLHSDLCYYIEV